MEYKTIPKTTTLTQEDIDLAVVSLYKEAERRWQSMYVYSEGDVDDCMGSNEHHTNLALGLVKLQLRSDLDGVDYENEIRKLADEERSFNHDWQKELDRYRGGYSGKERITLEDL